MRNANHQKFIGLGLVVVFTVGSLFLISCADENGSAGKQKPQGNPTDKKEVSGPWTGENNLPPDFTGNQENSKLPRLIFYTIPGCPECQSVEENVLRLKPEYIDRVKMKIIYITSDQGQKAQKYYNFHHGFVLLSPDKKILWRMEGHQISRHRLKRILDKHLKRLRKKN